MKYLLIILSILMVSCDKAPSSLQQVKKSGQLKVLIRNIPGVYYEGPFGSVGFDYELLKGFANHLGVKLVLIKKSNIPELLSSLDNKRADMAAGQIIKTEKRQKNYNFSIAYQHINQVLVYRNGTKRPRKLQQLKNVDIAVVEDSSQEELLSSLKKSLFPKLKWHTHKDVSVENLLEKVNDKTIRFTIANSNEIKLNQRFYPELRTAFAVAQEQEVCWVFNKNNNDPSLMNEANDYLKKFKKSHQLTILTERYYGHINDFDYVDTRMFQKHIKSRLPKYQPWFEKAGLDQNLDWNLLAAISYQESHWNNDAISPTGVKGLMMLTNATAEYIGVNNRLSPYQSIFGGAEYFAKLLRRIPREVKEPDRTLFALAAYNIGYGHLSDARKLCKKRGLDNTKWINLMQVLPLLQRAKWHSKTRYGYARGKETVNYVQNIREYYDILKWREEKNKPKPKQTSTFDFILPAL